MGTLTLTEFRDELLFDLKNRTDTLTSEGVTDTRLNLWINQAYAHISHPTIFGTASSSTATRSRW